MITSIDATNFRAFKNKSFRIGKNVTVFGGRNATGKSTLLAMLGNSCKLNYSKMKPLITKNFTAEFSEILKGSAAFDKTGSGTVYTVRFDEDTDKSDYRNFRISWPNNKTRFRVIPGYTYIDEKGTERTSAAKKDYPCIYLGLSRLYPVGESEEDLTSQNLDLGTDKTWYIENYKNILMIRDDIRSVKRVLIKESTTKKGVGVDTDYYDYITNSAGQDNIGQILLAILSFRRLKESSGLSYKGGLLLIDEVEASLHNNAQHKLIELFDKISKDLNLQIIFTTHSELILKHYSKIVQHNKLKLNSYELLYLHNANGSLDVLINPDYEKIIYDLNVTDITKFSNKVVVYSEDQETRWFAQKLASEYCMKLEFINIEMGCTNLLELDSKDPFYFSKIMFIFDGDVAEKDISRKISPNKTNKIILPGKNPPEVVIYEYLIKLSSDHELWNNLSPYGITLDSLIENGPNSSNYKGKQRDRNKKWFRDYKKFFDECKVAEHWIEDNPKQVDEFLASFKLSYNNIADLTFKSKIKL